MALPVLKSQASSSGGSQPPASAMLRIELIEGKEIFGPDGTLRNPFVEFILEDSTVNSTSKEKEATPTWRERFTLPLRQQATAHLSIALWHKMPTGREMLGKYRLSLGKLVQGHTHDVWLNMLYLDPTTRQWSTQKAALHIALTAEGFGKEAPQPQQTSKSLMLHVVEARDLLPSENGTLRPYVELQVGSTSAKTAVQNSANPQFNEHFVFPVTDETSDHLTVTVKHSGDASSVGKYRYPLLRLKKGERHEIWARLLYLDLQGNWSTPVEGPQILVMLEPIGFGASSDAGAGGSAQRELSALPAPRAATTVAVPLRLTDESNQGPSEKSLLVHVQRASDLDSSDLRTCVELTVGGRATLCTADQGPSASPEWNERFWFPVVDEKHEFIAVSLVNCEDQVVLGKYRLLLHRLKRGTAHPIRAPLMVQNPITGQWELPAKKTYLLLVVTANGFGLEPDDNTNLGEIASEDQEETATDSGLAQKRLQIEREDQQRELRILQEMKERERAAREAAELREKEYTARVAAANEAAQKEEQNRAEVARREQERLTRLHETSEQLLREAQEEQQREARLKDEEMQLAAKRIAEAKERDYRERVGQILEDERGARVHLEFIERSEWDTLEQREEAQRPQQKYHSAILKAMPVTPKNTEEPDPVLSSERPRPSRSVTPALAQITDPHILAEQERRRKLMGAYAGEDKLRELQERQAMAIRALQEAEKRYERELQERKSVPKPAAAPATRGTATLPDTPKEAKPKAAELPPTPTKPQTPPTSTPRRSHEERREPAPQDDSRSGSSAGGEVVGTRSLESDVIGVADLGEGWHIEGRLDGDVLDGVDLRAIRRTDRQIDPEDLHAAKSHFVATEERLAVEVRKLMEQRELVEELEKELTLRERQRIRQQVSEALEAEQRVSSRLGTTAGAKTAYFQNYYPTEPEEMPATYPLRPKHRGTVEERREDLTEGAAARPTTADQQPRTPPRPLRSPPSTLPMATDKRQVVSFWKQEQKRDPDRELEILRQQRADKIVPKPPKPTETDTGQANIRSKAPYNKPWEPLLDDLHKELVQRDADFVNYQQTWKPGSQTARPKSTERGASAGSGRYNI
eukprot:TRINITY_DN1462_c0_g1_i1.p1 TRINITY_DN1462_c0_g1~~TRINITY_DN1462_c0_g1_i1.p1  ORF type:complete len:1096 (+),score=211.77 TRINITY_DN1462_c0_g1_i1:97-3384(+)